MASSAILKIDVIADAAKAVKGLNDVGTAATKQQSKFKSMGTAIAGAVSVTAVVAFGKAAVTAASEDEAAQTQLASALKNTTNATDAQVAAAESYITSLSKQTATADDELRPALATLTRATGDQAEAQELLALSTDIAAGTGKSLETVTAAVAKAQQGNLGPLGKLTGGMKDAGGEALTLDEMMAKAADTFSGQAAVAAETTAGKMKGAEIAMGEASETIGSKLLPMVSALAGFLQDNINWLLPLAAAIAAVVAGIWLWTTAMTALGIIRTVIASIQAWAGAQGVLNAVMAANPIILIVLAIVALIAIIVLLVKNWDKVVAFLKKTWETIKKVAVTVWNAIGDAIEKVWTAIKNAVKAAVDWVKDKITTVFNAVKEVVKTIWNAIKSFFTAYWEVLKTIFGTPIEWIKDKVTDVFDDVRDTIKTVWNGIKTFFDTLWTDITDIFQTAWDYFEDFMEFLGGLGDDIGDMWEGVTDTLSTAWEGVMTGLKAGVNFFINGINLAIQGVNWLIDQVNKLPGVNIGHIPQIPTLARGGVLTQPTLFIGGEAGREIVTPEKLLRSILRQEGGAGGNYVLNMYPRKADAADVAWGFRRLELARTGR